jgi:hypothetical protein
MIGKMLLPLILTLLLMNSMFLFFYEMPTDMVTLKSYRDSGIINISDSSLEASEGMLTDIEGIKQTAETSFDGKASDEPSLIPEPFKSILYGVNVAGATISNTFNIGAFFSKWLFLGIFGYIVWIDFLLPIEMGAGVAAIALGLKGFLSLIIAKGFADILLPLFTGWRGN